MAAQSKFDRMDDSDANLKGGHGEFEQDLQAVVDLHAKGKLKECVEAGKRSIKKDSIHSGYVLQHLLTMADAEGDWWEAEKFSLQAEKSYVDLKSKTGTGKAEQDVLGELRRDLDTLKLGMKVQGRPIAAKMAATAKKSGQKIDQPEGWIPECEVVEVKGEYYRALRYVPVHDDPEVAKKVDALGGEFGRRRRNGLA